MIAKPESADPLVVDIPEAGRRLGVSVSTVRRLIDQGRLRSVTLCSARRIPISELSEFLARELADATAK